MREVCLELFFQRDINKLCISLILFPLCVLCVAPLHLTTERTLCNTPVSLRVQWHKTRSIWLRNEENIGKCAHSATYTHFLYLVVMEKGNLIKSNYKYSLLIFHKFLSWIFGKFIIIFSFRKMTKILKYINNV
jgi:hypothetical protein